MREGLGLRGSWSRSLTHTPLPQQALTAEQGKAGLEAIAGALQPQLVVHLRVNVLQRWQRRAVWVAVVPAHQGQAPQKQALIDLGTEVGLERAGSWGPTSRGVHLTPIQLHVRATYNENLLWTRTAPTPTLTTPVGGWSTST